MEWRRKRHSVLRLTCAYLALAGLGSVAFLRGQSAVRRTFEAASVKRSDEERFMSVRVLPGGRLSATAPVKMLILNAYHLQAFQLVGGAEWIDSERYAIEAKGEGSASREETMGMLQTLLEDRFQMKSHREIRQVPVYELTVGKSGPKLPPAKEGSCVDAGAGEGPISAGRPAPPPCGAVVLAMGPEGAVMQGGKVPMAELARTLAMATNRPVVDKTGFTGLFDVRLEFTPDLASGGMPSSGDPGPDAAGPSILGALQEQMGLKLESGRGPAEVLVIDRIERPSEN